MTGFAGDWLQHVGWPEKAALALLFVWLAAPYAGASPFLLFLIGLPLFITGTWATVRVVRSLLRKAIWRLRHRLMVTFLFIAVIPIGLVLAFFAVGAYFLSGQVAVYLVYARLDQQLASLENWATVIARAESDGAVRVRAAVEDAFPGAQVTVTEKGADEAGHGLTLVDGVVHGWARSIRNNRAATIVTPLSRELIESLDPELGAISLLPPRTGAFNLLAASASERSARAAVGVVPPPANALDLQVRWGSPIPIRPWGTNTEPTNAILAVDTRYSAIFQKLAVQGNETENRIVIALYVIGFLILIAEAISLIIGLSLTRTMTAAVHDLYEGTERVMLGDFSYRIPVRGSEQIADLSRSFNTMTENVESLLKVSKEKERMQAELEIARGVQQQLFPGTVPDLKTLELRAICKPARQVSGDYYDYQLLRDTSAGGDNPSGKVVLALGDVAGKGISAALLMATLQSTLRVQLREWQTNVSTERLVTGLNEHLYLNTTPEKYATFFLAIYDEETAVLEYTNAGHLPPLLIRQGTVTRLDTNGMVVGCFAGAKYDSSHLQMQPGDLIVCYTDGVTELENEFEEQFGEERLSEVLLRSEKLSLAEIEAAILEATAEFAGSAARGADGTATFEAQDDLTMLLVRRI